MATSAFKSTTKRTPIGATSSSAEDSGSSNRGSAHRRSRSLSRFSRRLPGTGGDEFDDKVPPSRGKFVNTTRGSGFPEISLDDLALEFFDSGDRGRSGSRSSETVRASGPGASSSLSERRGRSVSRQSSRAVGDGRGSVCNSSGGGRVASENNSRRRRSLSVVRCQLSDSESDLDHSVKSGSYANLKCTGSGNKQTAFPNRPAVSNERQVLRRSSSQKDLKVHDDHSSQSSVLTDDEGRDAHPSKSGIERIIRAVSTQKKAEHPAAEGVSNELYAAMREELRNAVEEIRMELGQSMAKPKTSASGDILQPTKPDVLQAVSSVRRTYSTKLEQSEKRKQDLLAEILLEEQRGQELSMIVKELLPDPKKTATAKPSRTRKRSSDRSRMSKRLTEEAEKYIEDFISNVEDTDISSLDGEKSDTSSSLGGIIKPDTFQSPVVFKSLPVEMDGVVLPWLQWEASNDATQSCKSKAESSITPITMGDVTQEVYSGQSQSNHSASSRGSWSPGFIVGLPMNIGENTGSRFGESGSYQSQFCSGESRGLEFDMDDYLKHQNNEDFLLERWKQQERINSGSLLLCHNVLFQL